MILLLLYDFVIIYNRDFLIFYGNFALFSFLKKFCFKRKPFTPRKRANPHTKTTQSTRKSVYFITAIFWGVIPAIIGSNYSVIIINNNNTFLIYKSIRLFGSYNMHYVNQIIKKVLGTRCRVYRIILFFGSYRRVGGYCIGGGVLCCFCVLCPLLLLLLLVFLMVGCIFLYLWE